MTAISVFVSYARQDFFFVRDLVKRLRDAKIEVWLDLTHLGAGDAWRADIDTALEKCTHCVFVVSPYAINSTEVQRELALAVNLQKAIIPVLLQKAALPEAIGQLQWLDFRVTFESAVDVLRARLLGQPLPVGEPVLPRREPKSAVFGKFTYVVCPKVVKCVAIVLFLSGYCEAFTDLMVVMNRPSENAWLTAILQLVTILAMWWVFRVLNRRTTLAEPVIIAVFMAYCSGFAFLVVPAAGQFTGTLRWLHLFLSMTQLAMVPVILRSRAFRRWMKAYPIGWGWK